MKKKLLTAVQFILAAGLIGFFVFQMYKKGQLSTFASAIQTSAANWPLLSAGVLLFAVCISLCNWRWKILLEAQGVRMTFKRTLMLYFVGQFFSSFMPGATSGDLFKAVYIAKESGSRKTEAVATVFIDRIVGLLALIFLTSVVTLLRLDFFLSNPQTKGVMIFNIILLLGLICGMALVFGQNIFDRIPLFRKLEEKTALGKIISKLYNAFHICVKSPVVLAKTVGLSLLNHVGFILCAVFIGKSIGISVTAIDYLTVFPIINAVAAIPLTPGGLGTRDAAAVFMLGLLGVTEPMALSLSILIYLATIFWSLVGGVVYLYYIFKQGKPVLPDDLTE